MCRLPDLAHISDRAADFRYAYGVTFEYSYRTKCLRPALLTTKISSYFFLLSIILPTRNPGIRRTVRYMAIIPVRNSYPEIASDSLVKSGFVRLGAFLLCAVFIKQSKNDFMLWRICPNGITTQFNSVHRNDFCACIQQYVDRFDMSAHDSGK